MSRWPTAKHFTSWLTLAPNNKISGGRLLSSKTQPSANRAAAILRRCAMSLTRTSTALGAFYRRLAARAGKATAITATARKLALLVYRVLRGDITYSDPGADAYAQLHRARALKTLANAPNNSASASLTSTRANSSPLKLFLESKLGGRSRQASYEKRGRRRIKRKAAAFADRDRSRIGAVESPLRSMVRGVQR